MSTLKGYKTLLERYRLLKVERLKAPIPDVLFKPAQRLRGSVHRLLGMPLGFFQIGEVSVLDPFIFRVVFRHGFPPLAEVSAYDGKFNIT